MIEQQARVLRVVGSMVRLTIGGQSGCAACDAGKGCGAGLFGKLLRRNPVELEIVNTIGARAGHSVRLGLSESLFMKLVFSLYGWPLIAGLAGAVSGHRLAMANGAGTGMLDLAAFAGTCAGVALVLIFWRQTSRPDISSRDISLFEHQAGNTACEIIESETHD